MYQSVQAANRGPGSLASGWKASLCSKPKDTCRFSSYLFPFALQRFCGFNLHIQHCQNKVSGQRPQLPGKQLRKEHKCQLGRHAAEGKGSKSMRTHHKASNDKFDTSCERSWESCGPPTLLEIDRLRYNQPIGDDIRIEKILHLGYSCAGLCRSIVSLDDRSDKAQYCCCKPTWQTGNTCMTGIGCMHMLAEPLTTSNWVLDILIGVLGLAYGWWFA